MQYINQKKLVDSIYEAGINASCWTNVLKDLSVISNSIGTVLVHWDGVQQGWISSSDEIDKFLRDYFEAYPQGNERTKRLLEYNHAGFVSDDDVFTPQELSKESLFTDFLIPKGFGRGLATAINSPSGESMIFHCEWSYHAEPIKKEVINRLDGLRPHFARASLLTTCLNKERANAAVNILEVLGLPGALVKGKGRLIACNQLFDKLIPTLFQDFNHRLVLTSPNANEVFITALDNLKKDISCKPTRSIPVATDELEEKHIVHVIPIKKTAHDLFPMASAVILAVPVDRDTTLPAEIIQGLFDLTVAEAKVAERVAQGFTLSQIAKEKALSISTVRNQLKSVFSKSGTRRQLELVKLLNGVVDRKKV